MPTASPPNSATLWKADAPYAIAERITFVYTSQDLAKENPQDAAASLVSASRYVLSICIIISCY